MDPQTALLSNELFIMMGTIGGVFIANIAVVIPLFFWVRTESRNDWRHMDTTLKAIQEEMKEFHTKLALQDQEFKTRLCAIEESRKK